MGFLQKPSDQTVEMILQNCPTGTKSTWVDIGNGAGILNLYFLVGCDETFENNSVQIP